MDIESKEEMQESVTKRASVVGLGTLLSRILGLVRESVTDLAFDADLFAINSY